MKKSLFVFLLSAFSIASLFAQRGAGHHDGGKLAQELNLSDQQKSEMKAIMKNYKGELKTIRQSDVSLEEKKAGINALKASVRQDASQVLDQQQLAKFDEFLDKKMKRRKGKGQAVEALNLSDDQKEQIKQLRETYKERRMALRTLPDEERKAEAVKLRTELENEMRSILSPAQFATWQDLKAERKHRKGK